MAILRAVKDRHPLAMLRTRAGGMTQLDLATRVGVTPGMVSQWERGEAVPHRKMAGKVDSVLNAQGEALEAFGYMPPGTLSRLAAVEEVAREGVPTVGALEAKVQDLMQRVATLEAAVQALKRRRPRASGE